MATTEQLNSGLLLRKAGESAYAASRRFIIANSGRSYSALAKVARSRLPYDNHTANARLSLIARLARQIEITNCEACGIAPPRYSLNPPSPWADNVWSLKISRNCLRCANAVFHSPFYELPWLMECPIHGCPLTPLCPTCGEQWPPISDIGKRQCRTCGVDVHGEDFIQAAADTRAWDFPSQPLLQRAVEYEQLWQRTFLHAGEKYLKDPFEIYSHTPIAPSNCYYPSIISDFDPEFRDFCRSHFVRVEPCFRVRFRCTRVAENSVPYDPTRPAPAWMMQCRRQVAAKITAAIARSAGAAHHLDREKSLADGGASSCAFCAAFTLWRFLIAKRPLRNSELFKWQLTVGRGLSMMPPIPQPMHVLAIQTMYFDKQVSPHMDIDDAHYALPLAAQRLLYALDLWTIFVALFQDAEFSLLHHLHLLSEAAIAKHYRCPPNYHESITRSIGFWKNKADELCLVIPKSLLRPRLHTPFAAHWVNFCIP
ncbi:MAG: hypothetical protein QM709_11870 [Spongiibacteraceae bacterium]